MDRLTTRQENLEAKIALRVLFITFTCIAVVYFVHQSRLNGSSGEIAIVIESMRREIEELRQRIYRQELGVQGKKYWWLK